MPSKVSDEDVDLISGALTEKGWHITTHHSTKKANADLRMILEAFLEGKLSDEAVKEKAEQFNVAPEDLGDQQAVAVFTEAIQNLGIDASISSHTPTMDVHSFEYGHGKMVTGPTDVVVEMTVHKYQIAAFVNFIKNHPFFKWA